MKLYIISKKQKGFTLIEIMVSSIIMLIVTIALASSLIAFLKMSAQSNNTVIANEIIQSALSKATYNQTEVTNDLPSNYVDGMTKENKNFSVDIDVTQDTSVSGLKEIKVSVYSGNRIGNTSTFKNKRFISRSAKSVAENN